MNVYKLLKGAIKKHRITLSRTGYARFDLAKWRGGLYSFISLADLQFDVLVDTYRDTISDEVLEERHKELLIEARATRERVRTNEVVLENLVNEVRTTRERAGTDEVLLEKLVNEMRAIRDLVEAIKARADEDRDQIAKLEAKAKETCNKCKKI
ncbi:hypothetical protein GGF32_006290 [Allomyces javanicus]|nr:hypothetical protein GGF32_006290 [Allomyces javanicus]